jgi:hypothetical protein
LEIPDNEIENSNMKQDEIKNIDEDIGGGDLDFQPETNTNAEDGSKVSFYVSSTVDTPQAPKRTSHR